MEPDIRQEIMSNPCRLGAVIQLYPDGRPRRMTPSDDLNLPGGIRHAAGEEVWYFADGRPHRVVLAEDTTVQAIVLPARTRCFFDPEGHLARFRAPVPVRLGEVLFRDGKEIHLHPSGRVWKGHLNGNQVIDGVAAHEDTIVFFYDNGRLAACELVADAIFQGIPCRGRSWVGFFPDGRLRKFVTAGEMRIEDRLIPAESWVILGEDGLPVHIRPKRPR